MADEAFVGVSDEYKNYADVTNKPFASEEGPEKELEDRLNDYQSNLADQSAKVSPIHGHSVGGKLAQRNAEEAEKADAEKAKAEKKTAAKQAPAPAASTSGDGDKTKTEGNKPADASAQGAAPKE